jgi:hypothetical protein
MVGAEETVGSNWCLLKALKEGYEVAVGALLLLALFFLGALGLLGRLGVALSFLAADRVLGLPELRSATHNVVMLPLRRVHASVARETLAVLGNVTLFPLVWCLALRPLYLVDAMLLPS